MEQLEKLRSTTMRSCQQLRKAGQDALAADLSYQLGIVTGLVMRSFPIQTRTISEGGRPEATHAGTGSPQKEDERTLGVDL